MFVKSQRRVILAALALAGATGVGAQAVARELPPYVYEQARAAAGTVVVLRVTSVQALPPGQERGACTLSGVIERVERGAAEVGHEVTVSVPCIGPDFQPIPGPFPGYNQDSLMAAQHVRVWMTAGRLVQRGLDFNPEQPA